jgi:hypothetical protein
MPSSSFSTTSDGTPRMVEVTGATVTGKCGDRRDVPQPFLRLGLVFLSWLG